MQLYLGADFAKYLFGSACAETNVVLLNIVTYHLLACFLCYFHHIIISSFLSFLDGNSAEQGEQDHSWHLGNSLFHLHVF